MFAKSAFRRRYSFFCMKADGAHGKKKRGFLKLLTLIVIREFSFQEQLKRKEVLAK